MEEPIEQLAPALKPGSKSVDSAALRMKTAAANATSTNVLSRGQDALRRDSLRVVSAPTIERRVAPWGASFIVQSGIAVDVVGLKATDATPDFVKFIKDLLDKIGASTLGKELLNEFDSHKNQLFKQPTGQSAVATRQYKEVTVVFVESKEVGSIKPSIKTESMNGRKETGKLDFEGGTSKGIPLIRFPHPRGGKIKLASEENKPIYISSNGVRNHPDFPNTHVPLHIALFHEFCHAYLDQIGISDFLHGPPPEGHKKGSSSFPWEGSGDTPSNIEEQFVCGLLAGKGVKYCENRYRRELGFPLRQSYRAVGIVEDSKLGSFDWGGPPKALNAVLRENGYKEEDINKLRLRIDTD